MLFRSKQNISPTSDAVLDDFMNTLGQSYNYEYKNPAMGQGERVGPMAQDLEQTGLGGMLVKDVGGTKMIDKNNALGAALAGLGRVSERLDRVESGMGDSGPNQAYWDRLEQNDYEDQLARDAELSALAPYEKSRGARVGRDFMDSLAPGLGDAMGDWQRWASTGESSEHPGETLSDLFGMAATSKKIPDEVPTDAGGRRVMSRMYPELPKVTHMVSESEGIYKLDPKTRGVRVPKVEPLKGDPYEVTGSWRPDPEALRLSGYKTQTNPRPRRPSQVSEVVNQYVEPGPLDVTHPSVEAMHGAGLDARTGKPINPPRKPDMSYLERRSRLTKLLRSMPKAAGLAGLAALLLGDTEER